jgi:pathogenesis-related protein 1
MLPSTLLSTASFFLPSLARPSRLAFRDAPSPVDQLAYLDTHNSERTVHNAPPLVWNQTLSDATATLAASCVFQHSDGSLGPFGENIAAGTGETPAQGVDSWNSESCEPGRCSSESRC